MHFDMRGDLKVPVLLMNRPLWSLVDLFSGPGGLSLGFKLTGLFEPVAAVECSSLAADTYEANIGAKVLRKRISGDEAECMLEAAKSRGYDGVDAVVGGPPCRPFSLSNRGGTRWEVIRKIAQINDHPDWQIFLKLVRSLRPKIVVAENVMGFARRAEVFSHFIKGLHEQGYTVATPMLSAENFGVPQKRRRIFILALRGLTDSKLLVPHSPTGLKKTTVADAISDLPRITNEKPGTVESRYRRGRPTRYQSTMRGESRILFDHIAHSVHPVMAKRFRYISQGSNLIKTWKEGRIPSGVLQASYWNGSHRRNGFSDRTLSFMHSNIYRRLLWNSPSTTITHVRKSVLLHPAQDRLLTVREAARLQSFPDWFRFKGSISLQYQQIADAVPPLLAKAVAEHIANLIERRIQSVSPVIKS
jgi:DNA (cytosine-5)-methyltransferase 1